jgi:hypothetical protein
MYLTRTKFVQFEAQIFHGKYLPVKNGRANLLCHSQHSALKRKPDHDPVSPEGILVDVISL